MVVICLLLLCAAGGLLLTGIVRDSDIMVGSSIGLSLVVALLLLAGLRGSKTGETTGGSGSDTAERSGGGAPSDDLPTQIIPGRAERAPGPAAGGTASKAGSRSSGQSTGTAAGSAPARGKVSAGQLATEPGRRDEPATEVIGSPTDETVVTGAADIAAADIAADMAAAADDAGLEDARLDDAGLEDDEFPDPPDEPGIEPVLPGERDRMAGLDVEVAVVDGRPRYHLIDCAFLDDKDAEPLLASEAVELGFTPCVRCRPVNALLGKDVGSSH
jgi:hypothetical protein